MEFPRLVYKSASVHALVDNEDQMQEHIDAGWFATVPEALAPKMIAAPAPVIAAPEPTPAPEPDDMQLTRDELKAKADELGIEYPANIPTVKLADMVDAALVGD